MGSEFLHDGRVMSNIYAESSTVTPGSTADISPISELLDHLTRSTTLTRPEAQRVVQEVLVFFGDGIERFVKRRHGELQKAGLANPEVFERIQRELPHRLIAAPELSVRQIRRIIYG